MFEQMLQADDESVLDMGRLDDVTRRRFIKWAGAIMLAGLVGPSILESEPAEALSHPVILKYTRNIWYTGQHTGDFTINGNRAYCINPSSYAAPSGTAGLGVHDDLAWGCAPQGIPDVVRFEMRKALYNSNGAPAYNRDFYPPTWFDGSGMNWDTETVCMHVLLSDIYAQDFNAAVSGTNQRFRNWAVNYITGWMSNDGLNPLSMRAHLVGDTSIGGDGYRFATPPDGFRTYIIEFGPDRVHPGKREYQRIVTFEDAGRVRLQKQAASPSFL